MRSSQIKNWKHNCRWPSNSAFMSACEMFQRCRFPLTAGTMTHITLLHRTDPGCVGLAACVGTATSKLRGGFVPHFW